MTEADLIALAKQSARTAGLDPALVCAVVEQESAWDTWAIRYEPAFYARYVAARFPDGTEARSRAFSWGLMQLMLETGRELGYSGTPANLCDPAVGLYWGCLHLKRKLAHAQADVVNALLAWNGGANASYPQQVLARVSKYSV